MRLKNSQGRFLAALARPFEGGSKRYEFSRSRPGTVSHTFKSSRSSIPSLENARLLHLAGTLLSFQMAFIDVTLSILQGYRF
jgi:hypothetical protein